MEEKIWKILKVDCKEFINIISLCEKGSFLFRGYKHQIDNLKLFKHNLSGRKPLHTPQKIHDEINTYHFPKFGWNIRNGAFCYGMNILKEELYDLGYGDNYIFFPIGKFDFVYDILIFDLYSKIALEKFDIESLNYVSTDLCSAIQPHNDGNGFGVEISIMTEKYILVNIKYLDFLIGKIWT